MTGRWRGGGPTPTSAERNTRGCWLKIASQGTVKSVPRSVITRCALPPAEPQAPLGIDAAHIAHAVPDFVVRLVRAADPTGLADLR